MPWTQTSSSSSSLASTSLASSALPISYVSPAARPRKPKRVLEPRHEEFREKVAFAFDLCRRRREQQLKYYPQQQPSDSNRDESSANEETAECCFLPLMQLTLEDETSLYVLKKLAKKNSDLPLQKLHLYQLGFARHEYLQGFLDIFQRYFPTIARIVVSSNRLQMPDIDAIATRFQNLEELCLYGSHALATMPTDTLDASNDNGAFCHKWDTTFRRLTSTVAREVTLPHMGGRLPNGVYLGLSRHNCIVERLSLKLDCERDIERLVHALCQGRSVRKLRLESAMCRSEWLNHVLMQYDGLEQLELYRCQNTHENHEDDRLAAWTI